MSDRTMATIEVEDPRGLLLAEHPHQNTQPRPMIGVGVPGEVWGPCQPLRYPSERSTQHFLCRGERREWMPGDGFKEGSGAWEVCGCWCHYLLAIDRFPPRRLCDCGAEALVYLGVRWPGIDDWTARHFCPACLTRQRVAEALAWELDSRSGGPELKLEWLRSPVTPHGRLGQENGWRGRSHAEDAERCPQRHGQKRGCPQCQTYHLRLLWRLDIGWGTPGMNPYTDPLLAETAEPWDLQERPPALAAAVAGGDQAALF
jgi:hypothetical protein